MTKWGSQIPKRKGIEGNGGYFKNKRERGLGFFGDGRAETSHHEPPDFEMPLTRRGVTKKQRALDLTSAEHAAFHLVRKNMFGAPSDNQAFCGQVSGMDEKGSDMFEAIMDNPIKVARIKKEILSRRKKFGLDDKIGS